MACMDHFLNDIEAFLEETGMAASTFGREALSDPSFVARIRSGGDCLSRTKSRVRAYMNAQEVNTAPVANVTANAET